MKSNTENLRPPRALERTSERLLPSGFESPVKYALYLRHLFAYEYAKSLFSSKDEALEIGFGEGYGTSLLADTCHKITAFDVSKEVVDFASAKYGTPQCEFQWFDGQRLPVGDAHFSAAVAFQVIEHIQDDRAFVREAYRVLREGGVFVITTPNRLNRLKPGQEPWNKFHVREYDTEGLGQLLREFFPDVSILGIEGNQEIQEMELKRVARQDSTTQIEDDSPKSLFVPWAMARKVIPRPMKRAMKFLMSTAKTKVWDKVTGRREPINDFTDRFQLSDFRIQNPPRYESLDLLAICRK